MIASYVRRLNYESDGLLFPSLKAVKIGLGLNKFHRDVCLDRPVSYNHSMSSLRSALTAIGCCGNEYSLHSLRMGGLSEAANSGKCSLSQLKRQGRWKADKMVDYYHKLSLDMKLQASRSLDLMM